MIKHKHEMKPNFWRDAAAFAHWYEMVTTGIEFDKPKAKPADKSADLQASVDKLKAMTKVAA